MRLTSMIWQCMLMPAIGIVSQQIGHIQACDGMHKQKTDQSILHYIFYAP